MKLSLINLILVMCSGKFNQKNTNFVAFISVSVEKNSTNYMLQITKEHFV